MTLTLIANMNERIKELAKLAQLRAEWMTPQGLEWFDNFKEQFAELIVKECYHVVVSNPHIGTSLAGANMKKHFELDSIGSAERLHSDKGYSIGTPEAQEAFERKRGYKL